MKKSFIYPIPNLKVLQNNNNDIINVNHNNESLNLLMTQIISKINVKNAGLKAETIINAKQKIFSQGMNEIENEGYNINNNFFHNNLNNVNNNFQKKKKYRFSVAHNGNFLRTPSIMKLGKSSLKNVSNYQYISEKNLNNYISLNSIKKTTSNDNNLLTNISGKGKKNENLKLSTDSFNNNDKKKKKIKKMSKKSVKFFSDKVIKRINNVKNFKKKYQTSKHLNIHNFGFLREHTYKNKKKNRFNFFQKISTLKIKKRSPSLKNFLNNKYNLKFIYPNDSFNKIKKFKTDINSTKFDNENLFKNDLFKKTLFEVNQIQNNIRDELYGNLSENEEKDKPKNLRDSNIKNSSENLICVNINHEYFRVLKRRNLVYDSLVDDGEDEDDKVLLIGKYYFLPNSIFKYILDFLLFLCIIYDNFIHSFLFAFKNKQVFSFSIVELIFNIILQLIYILDFISGFFLAYYQNENLITNFNLLMHHYYDTFLIKDFLQAIPFELIFFLIYKNKSLYYLSYDNPYNNYMYLTLIRKFKFVKFISEDYINTFTDFLRRYEHFYFYESVYTAFFVFFVLLHNVTCYYILLGKSEFPNWIFNLNLGNDEFGKIYTCALYFIISTLTTVGYGDISTYTCNERIFGIIILIFGILGYSYSLTNVSNYVEKMKSKSEDYEEKKKFLDYLQRGNKLNIDVYEKILKHLKYHETHKLDKNIILDALPLGLRNTLLMEIYKPIVNNFTFFKNISNQFFIVQILISFKPILAIKNDILIKDGDLVEEVFFVKNGKLSLEVPININEEIDAERVYDLFKDINAIHGIEKKSNKDLIDKIKKDKENNFNYINILMIREREHYGIIERYLNKRSFVRVKVKSKKAELLFLDKNDIDNLSESYPQIWKKINKKSLLNFIRLKKLIQKSIKLHYISNGIKINVEELDSNEEEEEELEISEENESENNNNNNEESLNSNIIEENDEEEEISENIDKNELSKNNSKINILNKSINTKKNQNSGQGLLELLTKKKATFNHSDLKRYIKNFDKENNNSLVSLNKKKSKQQTLSQSLINKRKNYVLKKNTTNKNAMSINLENNLSHLNIEKKDSESFDSHFEDNITSIKNEKSEDNKLKNKNLNIKKINTIHASNLTLKFFTESSDSESEKEKEKEKEKDLEKEKEKEIEKEKEKEKEIEKEKEKENTLTPFKKNEINTEIYPNEQNIFPINLKKNHIKKIENKINNVIINQPKKIINKNNSFEIIKNDNFIIPNSYENINKICNNNYIKDFKTQNEIKKILENKYHNMNTKNINNKLQFKNTFDKIKPFDFEKRNVKSNNNYFNITIVKNDLKESKNDKNIFFNDKNIIEKKHENYDLISNESNQNSNNLISNKGSPINNDLLKNSFNDNKNNSLLNYLNIS